MRSNNLESRRNRNYYFRLAPDAVLLGVLLLENRSRQRPLTQTVGNLGDLPRP